MIQIGFHLLENEWNYVFQILFSVIYSTKNLKQKSIKLTPIPNKMQKTDAAVSSGETGWMYCG
jgi:hypothetical protein